MEVPCVSRLFKMDKLKADPIMFVPLLSKTFDNKVQSAIWKQWQARNSYPKYDQQALYALEPDYARDVAFGKPAPANNDVGPRAYLDLREALAQGKTNSYVYVGVHTGSYVPSHDNKSVLIVEPIFLFAVLLRLK